MSYAHRLFNAVIADVPDKGSLHEWTQKLRKDTAVETASPFTRLPPELVHHILSLAAAASRHSSLNICLVASWARHIALPHLFHTVVITDDTYTFEFNALHPSLPANSRATSVRNVWLGPGCTNWRGARTICERSHDVIHLALNHYVAHSLMLSTAMQREVGSANKPSHDLHLTFIERQLPLEPLFRFNSTPLLLDRVTQIRFVALEFHSMQQNIGYFSRLSYLSVPYLDRVPVNDRCIGPDQRRPSDLQYFLNLHSLKMLVVPIIKDVIEEADREELEKWVHKVRQTDRRLYIVEGHSLHFRDEWEKEMRGGESIWDKAIRYTTEWEASL